MSGHRHDDLLRGLAPQVLGALVRRYGHFDLAEDAVQEALLAAATQWLGDSLPDNPRGWLITVASRRLTDLLRSEQARRRREDDLAARALPEQRLAPAADRPPSDTDDTLILLLLCCHPALSPQAQVALTLRAVGGLTTAQIARAFLVPEATMTRRISRAKKVLKDSGAVFAPPTAADRPERLAADRPERLAADRPERLAAVLHVLYLIFTEGYAATSGPSLHRVELSSEAIRLTRLVHRLLPDDSEVTGLLALMLLTDARRPARTGPGGELVPMAEQDRDTWDSAAIAEGIALLTDALPRGETGPYQLQAAISALHDEAPDYAATDWPQIAALYRCLTQITDNPIVRLNHSVAVAMATGPAAGLALVEALATDSRIADDHRLHAVRAHLLELSGDRDGALASYTAAAEKTVSLPQKRYLYGRAARLS